MPRCKAVLSTQHDPFSWMGRVANVHSFFQNGKKDIRRTRLFLGFASQLHLAFQFQRTDPVFTEEGKFKSNHSTPPCNLSLRQVLLPLKKENVLVFYNLLINHNYEIAGSELEL